MTTSTLDLRRPTLIDSSELTTRLPSIEQPAGAPHSFWPHQKKAYDAALASMAKYGSEIVHVASLPTGSGKTRVAAAVSEHYLRFGYCSQIIWLAPRWQILTQAESTIRKFCCHQYLQQLRQSRRSFCVGFGTI